MSSSSSSSQPMCAGSSSAILRLPIHVFEYIFSFLSNKRKRFLRLSLVCKAFDQACHADMFWRDTSIDELIEDLNPEPIESHGKEESDNQEDHYEHEYADHLSESIADFGIRLEHVVQQNGTQDTKHYESCSLSPPPQAHRSSEFSVDLVALLRSRLRNPECLVSLQVPREAKPNMDYEELLKLCPNAQVLNMTERDLNDNNNNNNYNLFSKVSTILTKLEGLELTRCSFSMSQLTTALESSNSALRNNLTTLCIIENHASNETTEEEVLKLARALPPQLLCLCLVLTPSERMCPAVLNSKFVDAITQSSQTQLVNLKELFIAGSFSINDIHSILANLPNLLKLDVAYCGIQRLFEEHPHSHELDDSTRRRNSSNSDDDHFDAAAELAPIDPSKTLTVRHERLLVLHLDRFINQIHKVLIDCKTLQTLSLNYVGLHAPVEPLPGSENSIKTLLLASQIGFMGEILDRTISNFTSLHVVRCIGDDQLFHTVTITDTANSLEEISVSANCTVNNFSITSNNVRRIHIDLDELASLKLVAPNAERMHINNGSMSADPVLDDSFINNLATSYPNLRSVQFGNVLSIEDLVISHPRIEKIRLDISEPPQFFALHCPALKTFHFSATHMSFDYDRAPFFHDLVQMISHERSELVNLEELVIEGVSVNEWLDIRTEHLRICLPNLRTLVIRGYHYPGSRISIPDCPKLKHLTLSDIGDHVKLESGVLNGCPQLRKLVLSKLRRQRHYKIHHNTITSLSLEYCTGETEVPLELDCPSLTKLRIAHCRGLRLHKSCFHVDRLFVVLLAPPTNQANYHPPTLLATSAAHRESDNAAPTNRTSSSSSSSSSTSTTATTTIGTSTTSTPLNKGITRKQENGKGDDDDETIRLSVDIMDLVHAQGFCATTTDTARHHMIFVQRQHQHQPSRL